MRRQINTKSEDKTHNWLTLRMGPIQITSKNGVSVITVKFVSAEVAKLWLPLFRLFRRLLLAGLLVLAGASGCSNTAFVKKAVGTVLDLTNNHAGNTGTRATKPAGITVPTLIGQF